MTLTVIADERMQVGFDDTTLINLTRPRKLVIQYPQQNPKWVREIYYEWGEYCKSAVETTNPTMYEEIRTACLKMRER